MHHSSLIFIFSLIGFPGPLTLDTEEVQYNCCLGVVSVLASSLLFKTQCLERNFINQKMTAILQLVL